MRSRRPPSPRQRCVPDVPQRPGQPGRCCDRVAARRDSSARERGRSDGLLASWLTLPRVAGGVAGHRHPQVASRLAPLGDHRLVVAPAVAARGASHTHTRSLSLPQAPQLTAPERWRGWDACKAPMRRRTRPCVPSSSRLRSCACPLLPTAPPAVPTFPTFVADCAHPGIGRCEIAARAPMVL